MEEGIKIDSAKNLVIFQYRRHINGLVKQCLLQLEDIDDGEEINYQKRRKRLLDFANDHRREFETQLESLDVEYGGKHEN